MKEYNTDYVRGIDEGNDPTEPPYLSPFVVKISFYHEVCEKLAIFKAV